MAITMLLTYTGQGDNALRFAQEMVRSGTVDLIRAEAGNLRYDYYRSLSDPHTVLLVDSWADQKALDIHHASPMMATIATLRDRYDLKMTAQRLTEEETIGDHTFIRR